MAEHFDGRLEVLHWLEVRPDGQADDAETHRPGESLAGVEEAASVAA